MAKYKIKKGFNAPNPTNHRPMPYEVYEKKLFGKWTHVNTFDTKDEAQKYINGKKENRNA